MSLNILSEVWTSVDLPKCGRYHFLTKMYVSFWEWIQIICFIYYREKSQLKYLKSKKIFSVSKNEFTRIALFKHYRYDSCVQRNSKMSETFGCFSNNLSLNWKKYFILQLAHVLQNLLYFLRNLGVYHKVTSLYCNMKIAGKFTSTWIPYLTTSTNVHTRSYPLFPPCLFRKLRSHSRYRSLESGVYTTFIYNFSR